MIYLWMRLCFDPNENGTTGGGFDMDFAGAMDKASEPEAAPAASEAPAPAPEAKPAEPKAEDDPEYDLDYEEEPGKKARTKLSELKAQAKWLYENRQLLAGSLKMREEAAKNPEFGKALQEVIKRSYNDKGEYQGAAVADILQRLEAKQEAQAAKVEQADDEIADMEKELEDLDPDSPNAKILGRNIQYAKRVKAQLQSALDQNKAIQGRLDGLDKFKGDLVNKEQAATTAGKVKQLTDIYDREIGALTDVNKADGYKFVDGDEKSDFDRAVRDAVASKAQAIKSDEEFVKVVKDVSKAVYDKMSKRREAYVNDYLKKKGAVPKEQPKVETKTGPRSFAEMGDLLAEAAMTPQA